MWFPSILTSERSRSRPARCRARPPLRCEALEDRCLPSSYGFTEIAEFGPNSFFSQPIMTGTLNDHGTVTFRAVLSSGGQGAFTRDMAGNLGVIALTNDVIAAMPIGGRINDSGTVSFCATLRDGTQAIFTGNGQGLTRITDTGPDSPFSAILPQAADVTNQGLVAFRATLKSGGTGVFTERAGEPPRTLYVTGGEFASILNQNIQRNGTLVAVLATLTSGGKGVFLGDGVTTTTIVTSGNTYSSFAAPVANDAGLVAFLATRADGSQAIMTGDGTRLTTVAATGGAFRDFTGNVSINNDGQVIFAADLAAGGRGIFSVRDGAVNEIIGTGDSLFSSTVSSLAAVPFSPRALNNFGQVGFLANLADGRTVWVRADSLTVTSTADSGPGSLRAAIAAVQSGDTINFDPSLAGQTVTLTRGELAITKTLDIEGLGADQLTVSGNHVSRIFDISGGVTVTIAGLTMTDGLADGSAPVLASTGGAILNFGALTLSNDILSDNQAVGDASTSPLGKPGRALGGGLANLGTAPLTISGCAFISNLALGADRSTNGNAVGGAFVNGMGGFATATIIDSLFVGNAAQAGSYDNGDRAAEGAGGALENTGALTVRGCTFSNNQAVGGNNSVSTIRPGLGVGGALISGGPAGPLATLVLSTSTFDHNLAIGGDDNQDSSNPAPSVLGPNDAFGGGIHISGGTAAISDCTFKHNEAIAGSGGPGQNGGLAVGGGGDASNLFAPRLLSATFSNCMFDHNLAIGGKGGSDSNGGDAWGGGLADLLGAILTVSDSTLARNLAIGGDAGAGGNGGNGLGGGIYEDALSVLTLMGATVASNHANGGQGDDSGSEGQGIGGGVFNLGAFSYDVATVIAHNHASTSNDDIFP